MLLQGAELATPTKVKVEALLDGPASTGPERAAAVAAWCRNKEAAHQRGQDANCRRGQS